MDLDYCNYEQHEYNINSYRNKYYIEHLKFNMILLSEIKNQTEEISKFAVSLNGLNLKYVKNKNKLICEIAIKNNGLALIYVPYKYINKNLYNSIRNKYETDLMIKNDKVIQFLIRYRN